MFRKGKGRTGTWEVQPNGPSQRPHPYTKGARTHTEVVRNWMPQHNGRPPPWAQKTQHSCPAGRPRIHAALVHTYLVGGRANAHRVQLRVLQHLVIIRVRLAAMIQRAPLGQLAAARRDAHQVRILQTKRNVGGVHLPNPTGADNANAEGLLGGIRLDEYQVVLKGDFGLLHPQGGAAGAGRRRRHRPRRHGRAMEGADRQGCADSLWTQINREQNASPRDGTMSASTTGQEPQVSSHCRTGIVGRHPGKARDPVTGPTPVTYISQKRHSPSKRHLRLSIGIRLPATLHRGMARGTTQLTLPDRRLRTPASGAGAAKAAIRPMLTMSLGAPLGVHQEPMRRARWRTGVRRVGIRAVDYTQNARRTKSCSLPYAFTPPPPRPSCSATNCSIRD